MPWLALLAAEVDADTASVIYTLDPELMAYVIHYTKASRTIMYSCGWLDAADDPESEDELRVAVTNYLRSRR
jgi:hypothetical protein